jgi:hypothetical protein
VPARLWGPNRLPGLVFGAETPPGHFFDTRSLARVASRLRYWHVWHRDCVNSIGTHQMTGELVAHSSLLAGTYSLDDRWSAERPLGKRASDYRPDAPAYLIVTVLLSLGIWAAIWAAVTSLLSASL